MAEQRRCQWRSDGSGRSAAVADEKRLWVPGTTAATALNSYGTGSP